MPDTFAEAGQLFIVNTGAFVSQFRKLPSSVVIELYRILRENPPQTAVDKIKEDDRFKTLREWIPNTPKKINEYFRMIAYLAAAYFFVTGSGKPLTDRNLIDKYNQIIEQQQWNVSDDACPCGSGRKFDDCHGKPTPKLPKVYRHGDRKEEAKHRSQ